MDGNHKLIRYFNVIIGLFAVYLLLKIMSHVHVPMFVTTHRHELELIVVS